MSDLIAMVRIFSLIPTKMKSKNGSDFEQRSDMVSLCYIDPCGYNVGCGLKWERVEAGRPL